VPQLLNMDKHFINKLNINIKTTYILGFDYVIIENAEFRLIEKIVGKNQNNKLPKTKVESDIIPINSPFSSTGAILSPAFTKSIAA